MSEVNPEQVDAAYALLMAAILHRDMAGAMPREFFASMPEDIRNRLVAPYYQDAFDALPQEVRIAARALVDADENVTAARQIGVKP